MSCPEILDCACRRCSLSCCREYTGALTAAAGRRGDAAGGHRLLVEAGFGFLQKGGSVADGGIAKVFAASVVETVKCGIRRR